MIQRRAYLQRKTPLLRSRGNKFGAIAVHDTRTGESWDSKGEHRRWQTLEWMVKGGLISSLVAHPRIVLIPRNGNADEIAWRADSSYIEDGRVVYEDYKPRPQTPRETLIFKLWKHYGPGLLRIVGAKGETIKTIMGKGA